MLKEVLNDALHNLHAESGALTSSAIVSIDGLPIVSVLGTEHRFKPRRLAFCGIVVPVRPNRPPALLRQFQSNDFARPAG